ncbi:MAG: aldose epimerase family protein [Ignavibacteriales bacterium]
MNPEINALLAVLVFCFGLTSLNGQSSITKQPFGEISSGQEVSIYKLSNNKGMSAEITNYGGIVVRLIVPDKNGKPGDVVLGFNNPAQYEKDSPYFGAIVGRYGNRIANGEFKLNGVTYHLAKNNDPGGMPCSLHGGKRGFDKVVWTAETLMTKKGPALKLSYLSKDGEEGYPGNLNVTVTYTLTPNNELKIDYTARTDKATPVNLTNHSYFNLKGEGEGNILDHMMMINGTKITPVNKGLIPTGKLEPVKGTPFDFTTPHKIGERIDAGSEQLKFAGGYDHNWVLNKKGNEPALAAAVYDPSSGRYLEVYTTQPGVQFYSGNFLDGSLKGKSGKTYERRGAFCLETQHYPDSPNHPEFPSTILQPGTTMKSQTIFKFSIK